MFAAVESERGRDERREREGRQSLHLHFWRAGGDKIESVTCIHSTSIEPVVKKFYTPWLYEQTCVSKCSDKHSVSVHIEMVAIILGAHQTLNSDWSNTH